jgi:hypothetical protein
VRVGNEALMVGQMEIAPTRNLRGTQNGLIKVVSERMLRENSYQ